MDFKRTIKTKGDGYWSNAVNDVQLTRLKLSFLNKKETFGELRVYFDTTTWDLNLDGLIYTDSLFIDTLGHELNTVDLVGYDVTYSKQGMQGSDFVSFDVGEEFIKSWKNLGLGLDGRREHDKTSTKS